MKGVAKENANEAVTGGDLKKDVTGKETDKGVVSPQQVAGKHREGGAGHRGGSNKGVR